MPVSNSQNLLSACAGEARMIIGKDDLEGLRRLSDDRALTCPGCGGVLVLHAGSIRAAHFAHLPGAVCLMPQTEPETPEHRAGKLCLYEWLTAKLPDAAVELEAHIPETNQRADVLLRLPDQGRIALEYQCANLSAREWRRRHKAYREAGIRDLWLLGGSRLKFENTGVSQNSATIRTSELERALLWDGAPLLFLDADGIQYRAGTVARFLPEFDAQALIPAGKLTARSLLVLEFPFHLLEWEAQQSPQSPLTAPQSRANSSQEASGNRSDWWLWEWLATRHRVTKETVSPLFGLELKNNATFTIEPKLWQACVYYRFVHRRVGDGWWLPEVESWARAYLPLVRPCPPRALAQVLGQYQGILAAAGMLSLPMGYGKTNARILADLLTLPAPPDPAETLKIAGYRRTLAREMRAEYKP